MAGIVNYMSESLSELRYNVSWVSVTEAQKLSIVVILFSVLFSFSIWGVDTLLSNIVEGYFNLVKG